MLNERLDEFKIKFAKPLLGFGMSPDGVSIETKLQDGSITQEQITDILVNAGKDLAKIHVRTGDGFGWIDPTKALITRRFIGQHNTWYEFLLAFYDKQTVELNKIFDVEQETKQYHAQMSQENREQLMYIHNQRPLVRETFESKKKLLNSVLPNILHGNVYIGSIFVKSDGRYAGLTDFTQMLNGDPLDDLAYFSVMPKGNELVSDMLRGWKDATGEMDVEERMHLYRLWESYRKTFTRYAKYRYLDKYPEPLTIARSEIDILK